MLPSPHRGPQSSIRHRSLRALAPVLAVAGATLIAGCGSSGLSLTPAPDPAGASSPGYSEQLGIIAMSPPTPSPSDEALAVQAYRAIEVRDSQLVIAEASKVSIACTLATTGDAACEDSIVAMKHMAQTMLADLKGVRVPARIATADREYRDGLHMLIAAVDDTLTYVATGSAQAHDRGERDTNTAEHLLDAADADLAKAL